MWHGRTSKRGAFLGCCGLFAFILYCIVSVTSRSAELVVDDVSGVIKSGPPFEKDPLHVFLRDGVQNVAIELNYWLRLLQKLERPVVIHPPTDQHFVSNSIIICFDASSFADSLAGMKLSSIGLFHVGDERGFSKTPQDHYRKFDFVFRTYFLPQIFVPPIHPRILWIPNGPRSDSGISFVPSGLLPSTRRKILCNFIGAVSGNPVARTIARQELKASLERQKNPCFLDITGQFGGTKSHFEYSNILRDSVFTICVRGHSEETIRLFDSMQAGSIPVVLGRPAFLQKFPPNPPFVFVDSWDVVGAELRQLVTDRGGLNELQKRVISYFDLIEQQSVAGMKSVIDQVIKKS